MTEKPKLSKTQFLIKHRVLVTAIMSLLVVYIAFVIAISHFLSRGYELGDIKIRANSVLLLPPFYVAINDVEIESQKINATLNRISFFSLFPLIFINHTSLSDGDITIRTPKNGKKRAMAGIDSLLTEIAPPLAFFAEKIRFNNINLKLIAPEYFFSVSQLRARVKGLPSLVTDNLSSNIRVSRGDVVFRNRYTTIETSVFLNGRLRISPNNTAFNARLRLSQFSSNFGAAKIDYETISLRTSFRLSGNSFNLNMRPILEGLEINGHRIESLDFDRNDLVITAESENIFASNDFNGVVRRNRKEIAELGVKLNPEKPSAEVVINFKPFDFKGEDDFIAFLNSIDDLRVDSLALKFAEAKATATISPQNTVLSNLQVTFSADCNVSLLNEFRVSKFNANVLSRELLVDYKTFAINGNINIDGAASAGFIPLNITADKTTFAGTLSFDNSLWPDVSSRVEVEYTNNLIKSNMSLNYPKSNFRNIRHFLRNHRADTRIRLSPNLRNLFRRNPQ